MPNGFHPPVEQYLAAIWELEEEGVEVIRARLAERVGHAAPSVSEMVRRLESDGYVSVRGRVLDMTPEAARSPSAWCASTGWQSAFSPMSSAYRGTAPTTRPADGNTSSLTTSSSTWSSF